MRLYQLALMICLSWAVMSCNPEVLPEQIVESDLVGQWDVTVRGGLLFLEFTEDNRVLIQDMGAIGQPDTAAYYYQDYKLHADNFINGLPGNCFMHEIAVDGDEISFVFSNPKNGHTLRYFGKRVEEKSETQLTLDLNRTWITTKENGIVLNPESQKIAYFSKTGLFLLKDTESPEISMFRWDQTGEEQLCYTEHQRPRFVPKVTCMNFLTVADTFIEFEVEGEVIRIEPTTRF